MIDCKVECCYSGNGRKGLDMLS